MARRLDDELQALKLEPIGAGPDGLEAGVWRRIDQIRERRAAAGLLLPLRAAAITGALAIGVVGGGLTAAASAGEPDEISVFSVDTGLAPSTLLDGH